MGKVQKKHSKRYKKLIVTLVYGILSEKFTLPRGISSNDKTTLDILYHWILLNLPTDYEYFKEGLGKLAKLSDYEKYYGCYKLLTPKSTLDRGGDCKSLAVLAVIFLRKMGQPTRFYAATSDHIIIEEYSRGRFWLQHDPEKPPEEGQLVESKPEYDQLYESVLKLLH